MINPSPSITISISGLKKSFKGNAFSLSVEQLQLDNKHRYALSGPSGGGKSSFLNLISGIINSDEGDICFSSGNHSWDFGQMKPAVIRQFRLNTIGFVYQNFEMVPWLSLLDNILLKERLSGNQVRRGSSLYDRAIDLITQSGLSKQISQKACTLSQGEQQRGALCRALLASPSILLADEPEANLDPLSSTLIVKMLLDYSRSTSALLIVASHNPQLLEQMDKEIVFDQGVGSFSHQTKIKKREDVLFKGASCE